MSTHTVLLFNSVASALAHNPTLAQQLSPTADDQQIVFVCAPSSIDLNHILPPSWENLTIIVQEMVHATVTDSTPSHNHARAIQFILEPHAQLDYQYHHISAAHTSCVTHSAQLAFSSTFNYRAVLASNSAYSNHTVCVTVAESAQATIKGAYLTRSAQQLRIRTTQKHVGKKSESNLLFKGIVAEQAFAAFTGSIRIEQSATYSSADQQNKNLLLGQSARAESIPLLEVLTNEVQCGHGSAVGQLDEQQLHYLMMRGIPETGAQQLLLAAFIADFDVPFLDNLLTQYLTLI